MLWTTVSQVLNGAFLKISLQRLLVIVVSTLVVQPFLAHILQAQPESPQTSIGFAEAWISKHTPLLKEVNQEIWSHPEIGLTETSSADQLIRVLESEGFVVQRGVAGMKTAFVATAGQGKPVIGILAEYDALPGMSQALEPNRTKRKDGAPNDAGHACGHSVFGTASMGAAVAAWNGLRATPGMQGTIKLFGTPAEETGIGKVYMARAGLFDDLDVALHWHAGDKTRVSFATSKAVISVKYRFSGVSAHASMSPQAGKSALDAVELMNVGANFLREHLKEDSRMHYVITDGGGQPNVVPATAEVWYYLRADSHADVEYMFERIQEIAEGAAKMTRTSVAEQIDSDIFELLPNRPLSELLQKHLEEVGPPQFDSKEKKFAKQTQTGFREVPDVALYEEVLPLPVTPWHINASTDVGNVSWRVPTAGLNATCYTAGAPGHSWQIVACTGTSIGEKGMIVATRTLARSALELMANPALIAAAAKDFTARRKDAAVPTSTLPAKQMAPKSIR